MLTPPPQDLPNSDRDWNEQHWKNLLEMLIENGLVSYKEVAAHVLGGINPPQVGTSLTTENFQKVYGKGKTMREMFKWFYAQSGVCMSCGTRIELQADHVNPKIKLKDEADTLDNIQLLCRRCNVIRRESHTKGGLTFLTTQAALMWILFVKQPKTYEEYHDLCREYGLTMANIRFQEGWAMAEWLYRQGIYDIDQNPAPRPKPARKAMAKAAGTGSLELEEAKPDRKPKAKAASSPTTEAPKPARKAKAEAAGTGSLGLDTPVEDNV